MAKRLIGGLLQLIPLLVFAAALLADAKPASAVSCNQDLLACYQQAAGIADFWSRTAYALDCELTYAGCVRNAILY
jgi:hypothetical protein